MKPFLRLCAIAMATAITFIPAPLSFATETGASIGEWGFDRSGMDPSVSPGDDFDRFANGTWEKRTIIPDDRVSFGPFANLRADADERSRTILATIPDNGESPATPSQKVAALFRAFLDETRVEQLGRAPLDTELDRIKAAASHADLAALMGAANEGFGVSIFETDLAKDLNGGRGYAVFLRQGGLRLPRDYYLEPRFEAQLSAYRTYAGRLLALAGWPEPAVAADQIIAFEHAIAAVSWSEEALRDPLKTRNPRKVGALEADTGDFDWRRFFAAARLGAVTDINLDTPGSVRQIARLYAATPVSVLKAWLAFRTADNAASYLPHAFVDARFELQQSVRGQVTAAPRWKLGVSLVNDTMGSALGELYVARFFPHASDVAMRELIENLRSALKDAIQRAAWMSPKTRQEALRKLANLEVQVGHPEKWTDYSGLTIRQDDLFGDVLRAYSFNWKRRVAQLGSPWNKSDWRFWPQYPTAYTENRQLIFTAAMLQPPFFDAKADPAVNYGAIGVVIGHELSHAFDDQGRRVDAEGKVRDWWTPADARRFQTEARRLSQQFSAMEPLPGIHIKGDLTLGENIADLAGMSIALAAYNASLGGGPAPVLDGFSGQQRFFLSWAQSWREKDRPESLRNMVASNVHSPPIARVNGPIRNIDAWYSAWGVTSRDALFIPPQERVRLW